MLANGASVKFSGGKSKGLRSAGMDGLHVGFQQRNGSARAERSDGTCPEDPKPVVVASLASQQSCPQLDFCQQTSCKESKATGVIDSDQASGMTHQL